MPSFLGEWVWDLEKSLLLSTKTLKKKKKPSGVLLCSKIILKGPNFGVFIVVMSFFPVAIFLNRMKEERWFHRIHLFSRDKGRADLKSSLVVSTKACSKPSNFSKSKQAFFFFLFNLSGNRVKSSRDSQLAPQRCCHKTA